MRSILKSHKRTGSSASDSSAQPDPPFNKATMPRSHGSPIQHQTLELTPPMNASGFHQLAMSSPKKLLTPIKKMFGHHSRPTLAPRTTEQLQSIILGNVETQEYQNSGRTKNIPPLSLAERRTSDFEASQMSSLHSSGSGLNPNTVPIDTEISGGSMSGLDLLPQINVEMRQSLTLDREPSTIFNSSDISIKTSQNSLLLAPSSEIIHRVNIEREVLSGADDDLRDSDDSSQFSFVKDIRGGRNTSVKYYKTKVEKGVSEEANPQNFFGIDDMGFEADALSDYDFENNGLSDDGVFDDEIPGGADRYGDFLSPNASHKASEVIEASLLSSSPKFDKYANSMSAGDPISQERESSESLPMSLLKSPDYAGDFFDTYLESRLPVNILSSTKNGIDTHGNGSSINNSQISIGLGIALLDTNSDDAPSRHSGTNIMDALRKLEGDSAHEDALAFPSPSFGNAFSQRLIRNQDDQKSFDLSESDQDSRKRIDEKQRESVADMMATLTLLSNPYEEQQSKNPTKKELTRYTAHPKRKRYSWYSNDDYLEQSELINTSVSLDSTERGTFDDDLLDEVNLVPENLDFEEMEDRSLEDSRTPNFLRSNSYKKKPQKIVTNNNFQETKIDLQNKIVTFYRSKSLDNKDFLRTKTPARVASVRSITSFNDEDIMECDENEYLTLKPPSKSRIDNNFCSPPELHPVRSLSLEPISEFETKTKANISKRRVSKR